MNHHHNPSRKRSGFTLIELLVVIAIIGILAGFLLPAIAKAQAAARRTDCISQLKQISTAIQNYRNSYDGEPPLWLSNMYPTELSNEQVFICSADPTYGKEGGKPHWEKDASLAFKETDDFESSEADIKDPEAKAVQNPELKANSYIYEFCIAECSWYDAGYSWNGNTATMEAVDTLWENVHPNGGVGVVTWREIKEWEVVNVGAWTPIVRCFWHTGGTFARNDQVLNIGSKTFNYYLSGTSGDDWKQHK